MPAYLDLAGFKARTLMPAADVDELEATAPGWILVQLEDGSDRIEAPLRKRYDTPFSSPYPKVLLRWLASIVTLRCYLKRGVDPLDRQFEAIQKDHDTALEELEKAANSETGLFELPLRADTSASGVSKGGPYGYSEQSPYAWTDRQARTGRDEDRNGEGTYG